MDQVNHEDSRYLTAKLKDRGKPLSSLEVRDVECNHECDCAGSEFENFTQLRYQETMFNFCDEGEE